MSQDQTLLLVDDNEDNLYTLSLRLKREGYSHIVTAGNITFSGVRKSASFSGIRALLS